MDFYSLQKAVRPPDLPPFWSWSALRRWRACPRQWWLSNAHYDNAPTPYPERPSIAAIEGTIVHHAVELLFLHARRAIESSETSVDAIRKSFPVRAVMRAKLSELAHNGRNPRIDVRRLVARISLDDCVNSFRFVAGATIENAISLGRRGGRQTGADPSQGSELRLRSMTPPLQGRPDFQSDDVLIDFKTGQPKEEDKDQIRFYALLRWLVQTKTSRRLLIHYLRTNQLVDVEPLAPQELEALRATYSREITAITKLVHAAEPEAKPSEENCSTCAVRQLCTDYWQSPTTDGLRLSPQVVREVVDSEPRWVDAEFTDLDSPFAGGAFTGTVHLNDVPVHVHVKFGADVTDWPKKLRILGARLSGNRRECSLTSLTSTEVFIAD